MPTYTDSARVNVHLPSSVPSEVSAQLTRDISDASGRVESEVGSDFALSYKSAAQKFPDITDSPATPEIVELAARYYAASYQWGRLGENVQEGEVAHEKKYEDKGEKLTKGIREGLFTITVSGESLKSSKMDTVQDEIYEETDDPVFNTDEINNHLYD